MQYEEIAGFRRERRFVPADFGRRPSRQRLAVLGTPGRALLWGGLAGGVVTDRTPPPRRLDLRGLRCPLPVLRTRKALLGLPPAAVLVVVADDPLAGVDIPHFLQESGDELIAVEEADGAHAFTVRRRARDGGA